MGKDFFTMSNNETEQIAGIFRNLGADQDQAITMACQLIKRAEQLAEEKNPPKSLNCKLSSKLQFVVPKEP